MDIKDLEIVQEKIMALRIDNHKQLSFEDMDARLYDIESGIFKLMDKLDKNTLPIPDVVKDKVDLVCDCTKQAGSLNLKNNEVTCWNCGAIRKKTELCEKPNCNRVKLDNSPLCSYHWDIANS